MGKWQAWEAQKALCTGRGAFHHCPGESGHLPSCSRLFRECRDEGVPRKERCGLVGRECSPGEHLLGVGSNTERLPCQHI